MSMVLRNRLWVASSTRRFVRKGCPLERAFGIPLMTSLSNRQAETSLPWSLVNDISVKVVAFPNDQ
jgi:hypothetical protein